ncbi:MAG: CPBP family intramembrane metalloprotease, partial [Clostridia bacterium]|nr:CPBP family intramembrane metalloprotease [Clostridia bacterium]
MGMAVLSNVLTNYLMMFLNGFGIQSPQFYDPIAYTTTSLILNVISTAVLPALVEEMIFRGYLMGTLRPHGDGIALVLSAFVFGLFHGNILQFPFAFMLGLVLGWLVIQTGSIWPAVALHFGNNLMSVLLSFFAKGYAEDTANSITGATFAALSAAGVVAIGALLIADRRGGTGRRDMLRPIGNGASLFTVRRRVWYTLTSPVLLISFIAMIAVLVLSLEVA